MKDRVKCRKCRKFYPFADLVREYIFNRGIQEWQRVHSCPACGDVINTVDITDKRSEVNECK